MSKPHFNISQAILKDMLTNTYFINSLPDNLQLDYMFQNVDEYSNIECELPGLVKCLGSIKRTPNNKIKHYIVSSMNYWKIYSKIIRDVYNVNGKIIFEVYFKRAFNLGPISKTLYKHDVIIEPLAIRYRTDEMVYKPCVMLPLNIIITVNETFKIHPTVLNYYRFEDDKTTQYYRTTCNKADKLMFPNNVKPHDMYIHNMMNEEHCYDYFPLLLFAYKSFIGMYIDSKEIYDIFIYLLTERNKYETFGERKTLHNKDVDELSNSDYSDDLHS